MAIRNTTPLSLRMILEDIGGEEYSTIDMIGLGVLVGTTSGVVGAGDNVVLPGDFLGEDISLTATSGTWSAASYNFPNSGGDQTITATVNGIYRVGNIPSWLSVTPVYGTGNTTFSFRAGDNSYLGAVAQASVGVQLIGSGDTVLDTINVSQTGNPVVFTLSSTAPATDYDESSETIVLTAGSNFDGGITITTGSDLITAELGSPNSSDPRQYDITITPKTVPRYHLTSSATTIIVEGTIGAGSIERSATFTQRHYGAVSWSVDSVTWEEGSAGTDTVLLAGATAENYEDGGHDFTVTGQSSYSWITNVNPSTGNYRSQGSRFDSTDIGDDRVTFTFSANTGAERTATITIEDDRSGLTDDLLITQEEQVLSAFDIDSGESDQHILNLPRRNTIFQTGTYSFDLTVTANGSNSEAWEIVSTTTSTSTVGPESDGDYYDTDYLQHKLSTDSSWTAITTALTGTGDATIHIRNPFESWLSFSDPMQFPLYRFRSTAYPSVYSQYVTIKQPENQMQLSVTWDGTTPNSVLNAICCSDYTFIIDSNTNTEGVFVGTAFGSYSIDVDFSVDLGLTSLGSSATIGQNTSDWSYQRPGYPSARPYSITVTITSNGNSTPSNTDSGTIYVYQSGNSSNNANQSPMYICGDATSCGSGPGGPS